jgi:hypothetical protein
MAVFKSAVRVRGAGERSIGEGMAYIHLPRGPERAQEARGTVSLRRWEPGADAPTHITLEDGRRLPIAVGGSTLSDCSRNHILRFTAAWPPDDGEASAESAASPTAPTS